MKPVRLSHTIPCLAFAIAVALLVFAGCVADSSSRNLSTSEVARTATATDTSANSGSHFAKPPAEERPGLATGWGERRDSRVTQTEFRRADGNTPGSTGTLYYNDREGMRAMLAQYGSAPKRYAGLESLGFVSVGLQDESGDWLESWKLRGLTHVVGEKGARYTVVVRNDSMGRIEVVTSVDGLDVLDGKSASYRKRGYILNPGETYSIEGFRTGQDSVAAFRFSSVSQSYAALKHDDIRNVGVIGVAAFAERNEEVAKRREADPFPRSWAQAPGY